MATQNATGGFIFGIGARDLEPGLCDFGSRMRDSPPSLRVLEPGARDFTFKSDILTLYFRNKT